MIPSTSFAFPGGLRPGDHAGCNCDVVLVWVPPAEVLGQNVSSVPTSAGGTGKEAKAASEWVKQAGVQSDPLAKLHGGDPAAQAKSNIAAQLAHRLNNREGWDAAERIREPFDYSWLEKTFRHYLNPDQWESLPRWETMSTSGHAVHELRRQSLRYAKASGTERDRIAAGWARGYRAELDRKIEANAPRAFDLVPEAERQSILDETASRWVQYWGESSGDTNYQSVWMQRAVEEELGIPGRWAPYLNKAKMDEIFEEYDETKATWGRMFVRAMYENTQEQFRRDGVTHVTVYRGMRFDLKDANGVSRGVLPYDQLPAWLKEAVDTGEGPMDIQPANSWSAKRSQATRFGQWIFQAQVPVERVLGTARTGWGCLQEEEFVVANGAGKVKLTSYPTEKNWRNIRIT